MIGPESPAGYYGDRDDSPPTRIGWDAPRGAGTVEIEVRDGVGLGGIEGGRLIEEPREGIALGRAARGREGGGL